MPGRRLRGRPNRRFIDVAKEDMKVGGVRKEDGEDRWRQLKFSLKGSVCRNTAAII